MQRVASWRWWHWWGTVHETCWRRSICVLERSTGRLYTWVLQWWYIYIYWSFNTMHVMVIYIYIYWYCKIICVMYVMVIKRCTHPRLDTMWFLHDFNNFFGPGASAPLQSFGAAASFRKHWIYGFPTKQKKNIYKLFHIYLFLKSQPFQLVLLFR